jgi:hypothetical protein
VRSIAFASLLLACAPAIAGNLKVSWQPNTESDLAGYFVYYGTKDRPQRNRIDVGRQTEYRIQNLTAGETYYIAVTAVDREGNESLSSTPITARILTEPEKNGGLLPQHYLLQSHPNPFQIPLHKNTAITFELSEDSPVKLEIFNVLGQRLVTLVDKNLKSGAQKISWNGLDAQKRPAPAGVYLYRLETSRRISTRKLVVYR